MRKWFVYKTIDSRDMGLYIGQMPEIVRPAERISYKNIPGRAGVLSYREGENVYDGYQKAFAVYHLREQPLDAVLEWLRGDGELILSEEPDRAYIADLTAEVRFAPVDNDWEQATLSFLCQPYKKQYPPELPVTVASTATIYNPGNIPAKPMIEFPILPFGAESGTLTVNDVEYTFTQGGILVDCDAEIVRNNFEQDQHLNMDAMDVSNGFPVLEPGTNTVVVSGFTSAITITPRWRWI